MYCIKCMSPTAYAVTNSIIKMHQDYAESCRKHNEELIKTIENLYTENGKLRTVAERTAECQILVDWLQDLEALGTMSISAPTGLLEVATALARDALNQ